MNSTQTNTKTFYSSDSSSSFEELQPYTNQHTHEEVSSPNVSDDGSLGVTTSNEGEPSNQPVANTEYYEEQPPNPWEQACTTCGAVDTFTEGSIQIPFFFTHSIESIVCLFLLRILLPISHYTLQHKLYSTNPTCPGLF